MFLLSLIMIIAFNSVSCYTQPAGGVYSNVFSVLDDDDMESVHVTLTRHTRTTTCLNSDPAQGNKTALLK